MKIVALLFFALFLVASSFAQTPTNLSEDHQAQILQNYAEIPIPFRPNHGQWEDQILYRAGSTRGAVSFLSDGMSFAHRMDLNTSDQENKEKKYDIMVWNISLEGSMKDAMIIAEGKQLSYSNYLSRDKNVSHVPDYSSILYKGIYENTDLRFYTRSNDLKYDYILRPGANVKNIRMKASGIQGISMHENGDLLVNTAWGTISERKPYAYQMISGKETEVAVKFKLLDNFTYGFEICGYYDPTIELVIDPVILMWSTFVGGTGGMGSGNINDITLEGMMGTEVYGTGYYNASFPTTPGSYDQTFNGGDDVYVFKLNATGTALIWSTYVGGPGNEYGLGIIVKPPPGQLYITGYTTSAAFPTTPGVFGPVYGGGVSDAIYFGLSLTGDVLLASTFIGGSAEERGNEIHIDGAGIPYITGYTSSPNFPTTPGAFDLTANGGFDAFYLQLPPSAAVVNYSTYIGGAADDFGNGIFLQAMPTRVFVVGSTLSGNFPVSPGAFDITANGLSDAFVFAFDVSVTPAVRFYATYLGGAGDDFANSCFLGFTDEIMFVGSTNSAAFPVTPGAYDLTANGGFDVFVSKMNLAGNGLLFSTYIGGTLDDYGEGIVLDFMNEFFIAGTTTSADFPTTCQGYDLTYNGGTSDIFLAKFNATASSLFYSSYFGGSNKDYNACLATSYGLSFAGCEGVILGFNSHSANFPTTLGSFQPTKLNEGTPGLNPQPGLLYLRSSQINANFTYSNPGCGLTVNFTDIPCNQWTFSGPFNSWSWSFGDATFSNLQNPSHVYAAPGNYTVTLSVGPSCGGNSSQTITVGVPPTVTTNVVNVTCNGGNNGSATANVVGGASPYTYSWSTVPVQTTVTATGLVANTYTVTVTAANGCTATATATITQPPPFVPTISGTNTLCAGQSTTLTATGGGTYLWNTGPTTAAITVNPTTTTTYTVTVTNIAGCTGTATQTVTVNANPTATISGTTTICNGQSTTLTASGGGTYLWNTGPTTAAITVNPTTTVTYTVTVTSVASCTATATQTVTVNALPIINMTSTNSTCGNNNGTATATVTNGNGPWSYVWNNGQTTQIATGLGNGTYTVTVTNAGNCTQTATIVVLNANGPTASITSQINILCNGDMTGSATVTAAGGTAPYTYLWSSGGTGITENNLGAGTYTVTVTDANTCTVTQTVTLTEPPALTLNTSSVGTNCGNSNGTATANAGGGVGPYSYLWSNAQITVTATGLSAATYTVTITDANGCTLTATATVSNINGPSLSINLQTNVLCFGDSNGDATSSVSGGTSPYTYLWSNGQTTVTSTGLIAGTYTLTVTDAAGCTITQTVTITEPPVLTATVSSGTTTCGNNDGSINANGSGGTGPYTYLWNPGNITTGTASNLSSGTYTVIITDANGCTFLDSAIIAPSTSPQLTITSFTNVLCNGGSTGTATSTVINGTAPYTYLWSNGQTNSMALNLQAGNYTVTVTDASGCTSSQAITITEPQAITGTATSTNANCGSNDGTVTANASGGTSPYTYVWSNGSSNQNVTGLASGTYTVTITDANGCTFTASTIIGTNGGPTADAGPNVTIQTGGSTTLNGTGGGSYAWSPATGLSCTSCQNPVANPAQTTTYYLIVTDINGCTSTDSVTIFVEEPCDMSLLETLMPNAFSPNTDGTNDELCVPGNPCIKNFILKVYDRWGEKVFETESLGNCWNGLYKGKDLNTAVFVYFLEATLNNGDTFNQKGNVSLIK